MRKEELAKDMDPDKLKVSKHNREMDGTDVLLSQNRNKK